MRAIGNIQRGIIAGKLKGAMPAQTPRGVLRLEKRRPLWKKEASPQVPLCLPPVASEVHVLAHPDQVLPDQQVGHTARLLNNLPQPPSQQLSTICKWQKVTFSVAKMPIFHKYRVTLAE